ncbi:hypothetical protein BGX23_010255 [Mortierella sp. AD031]|nr:hypothetical protein BGX23_010255 [Mortierella sp. AD031]
MISVRYTEGNIRTQLASDIVTLGPAPSEVNRNCNRDTWNFPFKDKWIAAKGGRRKITTE